jgi:hypothetical protein
MPTSRIYARSPIILNLSLGKQDWDETNLRPWRLLDDVRRKANSKLIVASRESFCRRREDRKRPVSKLVLSRASAPQVQEVDHSIGPFDEKLFQSQLFVVVATQRNKRWLQRIRQMSNLRRNTARSY